MKRKENSVRRLVTLAICVSLAMVLSYVETLIPVFVPVPGVKIGLANIATVFALYTLGGCQPQPGQPLANILWSVTSPSSVMSARGIGPQWNRMHLLSSPG